MTSASSARRSSWRWFWACAVDEARQRWGSAKVEAVRSRTDKLVARLAQVEADVERGRAKSEIAANRLERVIRRIELSAGSSTPAR
jgi:hypothetical protein